MPSKSLMTDLPCTSSKAMVSMPWGMLPACRSGVPKTTSTCHPDALRNLSARACKHAAADAFSLQSTALVAQWPSNATTAYVLAAYSGKRAEVLVASECSPCQGCCMWLKPTWNLDTNLAQPFHLSKNYYSADLHASDLCSKLYWICLISQNRLAPSMGTPTE